MTARLPFTPLPAIFLQIKLALQELIFEEEVLLLFRPLVLEGLLQLKLPNQRLLLLKDNSQITLQILDMVAQLRHRFASALVFGVQFVEAPPLTTSIRASVILLHIPDRRQSKNITDLRLLFRERGDDGLFLAPWLHLTAGLHFLYRSKELSFHFDSLLVGVVDLDQFLSHLQILGCNRVLLDIFGALMRCFHLIFELIVEVRRVVKWYNGDGPTS